MMNFENTLTFAQSLDQADPLINRFAGWWSYQDQQRFKMEKGFIPEAEADGWQVSCTQVMPTALYYASLQSFRKARFTAPHRTKSKTLSYYLFFIINEVNKVLGVEQHKIITPFTEADRRVQVSIIAKQKGKAIFQELVANNVLGDWREQNVIRLSPVPLYNLMKTCFRPVLYYWRSVERPFSDQNIIGVIIH